MLQFERLALLIAKAWIIRFKEAPRNNSLQRLLIEPKSLSTGGSAGRCKVQSHHRRLLEDLKEQGLARSSSRVDGDERTQESINSRALSPQQVRTS